MNKETEQLFKYIQNSDYTVFFGGAGVSTESGIPDFRGKDGLYNNIGIEFKDFPPEYYLSHDCLINNTKEFFKFIRLVLNLREYEPNVTHNVLAKLENTGKLQAVITQNIDGLHQKSGSKNVIEIHGNARSCICNSCGMLYASDYIYKDESDIPTCKYCGGYVRPDITLYGEIPPPEAMFKASNEIKKASLLIIGGTSLSVHPGSSLIRFFKGKHIVVINNSLTDIPTFPDTLFIQSNIGKVFKEIDTFI